MAEQLKKVYDKKFIEKLADAVKQHAKTFNKKGFLNQVFSNDWKDFELKERMRHITLCLDKNLSGNYKDKIEVLKKAAPEFGGFEAMFFPDYVEVFGEKNWSLSIKALEHFTKYSSSEFAVRPFIQKDPEKMMDQMLKWSKNKNEHVKRLASEGCRPRLPWAMALRDLKDDPSSIIPILENLKDDDSLYVRRSVANNLNDISKDHPNLVIKVAKKWLGESDEVDWVVKHALRTLLKKGNPKALALFGHASAKNFEVSKLKFKRSKIKIGEEIEFSFDLEYRGRASSKVRLEYVIHYVKANGKLSGKVFKLSEKEVAKGAHHFKRKHSFKQMSTRKHYPGRHQLDIKVNGQVKGIKTFQVQS